MSAAQDDPVAVVRTFDEAFAEMHLTEVERHALVWHLAAYRARKTVEALLPETRHDFDPRDYGMRAKRHAPGDR
jgi:hypothetical protein